MPLPRRQTRPSGQREPPACPGIDPPSSRRAMADQPVRWARLPPHPATRRFRLHPLPADRLVLDLRVSRTRRLMHADVLRTEGQALANRSECMGMVKAWHHRIGGAARTLAGQVYARMYLNLQDLQHHPEEIITHECTHAALAWARLHRLDLRQEAGEELLCYANGLLTAQVVQACRRACAVA